MPINKNHEFEELNGIKCAIVEKNVLQERVDFLRSILELNKYTVVIASTPPPKATVAPASAVPVANETNESIDSTKEPAPPSPPAEPPAPSTFTVGVTDVSFNPVNAIFGRLLKTKDGHTVTLAYWQQKEETPRDDVPYFEK
jgi:hypothetical protein